MQRMLLIRSQDVRGAEKRLAIPQQSRELWNTLNTSFSRRPFSTTLLDMSNAAGQRLRVHDARASAISPFPPLPLTLVVAPRFFPHQFRV